MNVGSLFSGGLGLDLGLEAAGHRIEWACESDPDCRRLIAARRPELEVVDDVREVDDFRVVPVDVLAGGFPCQDLSYAGRGAGLDGDRSGLWTEMARCVCILRPRFVVVENVPGLATRGLGRVLYDLAARGYVGRWLRLRASDVGAPHRRERIFVFATSDAWRERLDGRRGPDEGGPPREGRHGRAEPARHSAPVPDTGGATGEWGIFEPAVRRWERILGRPAPAPTDARRRLEPRFVEWMLGYPDGWTDLDGMTRRARLRILGNSVQVQVGELVGRMLDEWAEAR